METLLVILISYFLGTISGSYILGKLILKIDIRSYGSGNAGTTNAMRVMGKKLGVFVFLIDFFKAVFCMFFISKLFSKDYLYLSMLFCVIGHCFPFYMKFKGGKGVATTFGSLAFINPKLTIVILIIWVLVTLIVNNVGIGSVGMYIGVIVVFLLYGDLEVSAKICIILNCIFGILRHSSNIKKALEK
ncbi:glycerol-3-phosphate 1-O-acyltransferase PlsY [Peptoniphilus sp. GNH]|nr:acyl-phosphate glycerol 3-phosphate acyltransferase [Clostridiales bacterium KA00134]UHR03112.1 glycerol-3-phosphate 1-O-acyltransferase PlsY [Peptoniphilus sp. GNH]